MIAPIVSVTCESRMAYFPSSHTALNLLRFVFCLLKGLFDWYLQDRRLFLTALFYGLPLWLSGRESACQCRRLRLHPWVGKIRGEGNGNPLQYPCLGNPMDRGSWPATVHGVPKSQTRLGS